MCRQEDDADERDDGALLQERAFQSVDGGVDEVRAVVDRNDVGAGGQARGQLRHALLHVIDHVERIEPETLQRDAACDLSLTVEFGDPTTFIGAELDPGHIAQQDGRPIIDLHGDLAEIVDAPEIPLAPHDEFKLGQL